MDMLTNFNKEIEKELMKELKKCKALEQLK